MITPEDGLRKHPGTGNWDQKISYEKVGPGDQVESDIQLGPGDQMQVGGASD